VQESGDGARMFDEWQWRDSTCGRRVGVRLQTPGVFLRPLRIRAQTRDDGAGANEVCARKNAGGVQEEGVSAHAPSEGYGKNLIYRQKAASGGVLAEAGGAQAEDGGTQANGGGARAKGTGVQAEGRGARAEGGGAHREIDAARRETIAR
jgi:hypothetical protein